MQELWESYRDYLLYDVLELYELHDYNILYDLLIKMPFSYTKRKDAAREKDGKNLRVRFCDQSDEYNITMFDETTPCSVLEMLIALAIRMDKEWVGIPGEPNPSNIFKMFMDNLGLKRCTDGYLSSPSGKSWLNNTLFIWMDRDFDRDGRGSLFPLKKNTKIRRDQRKLDIWKQMMCYIDEWF